MTAKPAPPTQEQIDRAHVAYRQRLAQLHEVADRRDLLMRNRRTPRAIGEANEAVARQRETFNAARAALIELLDLPGALIMF